MATPEIDLKKIHDVFADAVDKMGGNSKQSKDEFDLPKEPPLLDQFREATKKIDDAEAAAKEERKKQHTANAKSLHNAASPQQAAALKTNMALMEKQQTNALNRTLEPLEKQKKEIKDELKPVKDPIVKASDAAKKIRDMTAPGKEIDEEVLSKNISEFYNDLAHAVNAINSADKKSALGAYKKPILDILQATNEVNTDLPKKDKIAKFIGKETDENTTSPDSEKHSATGHSDKQPSASVNRAAAVKALREDFEAIYPTQSDGVVHIKRTNFLNAHATIMADFTAAREIADEIIENEKHRKKTPAADVDKFHEAMNKAIKGAHEVEKNIGVDKQWEEGSTQLQIQLGKIEKKLQKVPDLRDKTLPLDTSSLTPPLQGLQGQEADHTVGEKSAIAPLVARKNAVEALKLFELIDNPKNPDNTDISLKNFAHNHLGKDFVDAKKIAEAISDKNGQNIAPADIKMLHEKIKAMTEKSDAIYKNKPNTTSSAKEWEDFYSAQLMSNYLNTIDKGLKTAHDFSGKASSIPESQQQRYAVQQADPAHYGQLSPTTLAAQTKPSVPNLPDNGGWSKA